PLIARCALAWRAPGNSFPGTCRRRCRSSMTAANSTIPYLVAAFRVDVRFVLPGVCMVIASKKAATLGLSKLGDYVPLIGTEAADRISSKARALSAAHVVHISSTFYGGGVSELLTPLTLMMNELGIETGWRMIQGTPAFFTVTKKMHNAAQGEG